MGNVCGGDSASDLPVGQGGDMSKGMKSAKKMNEQEIKDLASKMAKAYILKYDKNGNGTLDAAESKVMCKEIGTSVVDLAIGLMPGMIMSMAGGKAKVRADLES